MSVYLIDDITARAAVGESFDALYDLPEDSEILAADIAAAETEVDSHLKRFQLPLANAQAISYVRTALVGPIFSSLAWRHGAGDDIPEKIKEAAKTARAMLEKLRKGDIDLAGAAAIDAPGGAAALVVSNNTPEFNRGNMESF